MIKRIKLWWAFQVVAFVALLCPEVALKGLMKTFKEADAFKAESNDQNQREQNNQGA